MKKYRLYLIVLFLVGCSSYGKLKIINKTDHLLYFKISFLSKRTVNPHQSVSISLKSGKNYLFNQSEKKYDLYLEGETFLMYNGLEPTTNTKITVTSDKTTKIYANPNMAGIKIINNSNDIIRDVGFEKIYPDTITEKEILIDEIAPESEWFKQIPYSCESDSFDIRFSYVKDENDTINTKVLNLKLDQQFLLEIR